MSLCLARRFDLDTWDAMLFLWRRTWYLSSLTTCFTFLGGSAEVDGVKTASLALRLQWSIELGVVESSLGTADV